MKKTIDKNHKHLVFYLFIQMFALYCVGQNTITFPIKNKPGSKVDLTSFIVHTGNGPTTTIEVPAGWDAARIGSRGNPFWLITGNALAPGDAFDITVTNSTGNARVQGVSADYLDSQGRRRWGQLCSDPISATVVEGGNNGSSYLGYEIPPNEYGYFYQMWNKADFSDQVKTSTIRIGKESEAYNFQILSNSFPIDQSAGFDLQDIEVWSAVPENTLFESQEYMEEIDATGIPGQAVSWHYNPITGYATMTFVPDDPSVGLGAGETGSVVAYTSPYKPGFFSNEPNVEADFIGPFSCPKDYILTPGIPNDETVFWCAECHNGKIFYGEALDCNFAQNICEVVCADQGGLKQCACPVVAIADFEASDIELISVGNGFFDIQPYVTVTTSEDSLFEIPLDYHIYVNDSLVYADINIHTVEPAGSRCIKPGCITPAEGCQVVIHNVIFSGECIVKNNECKCRGKYKLWPAPGISVPDNAEIKVVFDPFDSVLEIDESNNIYSSIVSTSIRGPHLVTTAGAFQTNNIYSLAWSLGEPVVGTSAKSTSPSDCYFLRQGFQQPFGSEPGILICPPASTIEIGSETISVQVFPNPSEDYVMVTFDKVFPHLLFLSTLDGRLLSIRESDDMQNRVDLVSLPSGLYILTVADAFSNTRRIFKIQKF